MIERQLAHVPDDQVRAAYNAALYLDERTRMLDWWSNKLEAWEFEVRLLVFFF